jgi:Kef-type K+ transport system membrane component KefB
MRPLFGSGLSINKNYLSYIVLLLIFGGGTWFVLEYGSSLNSNRPVVDTPAESLQVNPSSAQQNDSESAYTRIGKVLQENLRSPLSILFLQIIVIIVAARLFGKLFKRIGQPSVMGEIVAGIVLGPSVLGLLSPETMNFLFPASSMATLRLLSQIGVVLFMFVVGMELNAGHLREKASSAIMISHASIIIPFFLGTSLSLLIYRPLASANTSFTAFALFMGIAMSITAFPVLARILEDCGMSQSYLGSTAIACAAVDDVTAWCILAVVIAIANANGMAVAMLTIGLALFFITTMLLLIKPQIGRMIKEGVKDEKKSRGLVAGILAFVLACACFTEIIGIHALFGAFLAGVVMPSVSEFRFFLKEKLETFSSSALLPLFFAFTGLRTQISLLNDWAAWLMCLGIIAVAIAGKLGGSMLAARWTGMSWRDSFSIGALMNTRGLIELIVLNIGYDLGILPARIFAMMVIMALVTTSMTGPLLSLVKFKEQTEPILTGNISSAR